MDREFNLIDEPWICVRDNGCEVKEISIRQVFEHAQDYTELAGETKTQDMAVLRFLLAMIYTVFSRYEKTVMRLILRMILIILRITGLRYFGAANFR